jgi:hypothetical protein
LDIQDLEQGVYSLLEDSFLCPTFLLEELLLLTFVPFSILCSLFICSLQFFLDAGDLLDCFDALAILALVMWILRQPLLILEESLSLLFFAVPGL